MPSLGIPKSDYSSRGLKIFKKGEFEDGVVQEIINILMGIERLVFSKHFLSRYQDESRSRVVIPSKEMLLNGEFIEYRRNRFNRITEFVVKVKNRYKKINLIYVVGSDGKVITAYPERKGERRK